MRWPLLIIGLWIAVAVALTATLPPLHTQAAKRQQAPLPDDAPSIVVGKEMGRVFHEIGGGSLLFVVLIDEEGLTPADEDVYRKLVDNLRLDSQRKIAVQDFISAPPMREVYESKDHKAWTLPVNLPGEGHAAETQAAYRRIVTIVQETVAGTSLTARLSGPVATISDFQHLGEKDAQMIEIGTAVSVLTILFIVYRNLITMLVPLVTIGLSVLSARGVLSALAEWGLALNMQCIVFMSAVMIGAGTDYAVFLISRYHDYVRQGHDSDKAIKQALLSIGKVIAASAATVAITFLAMIFTGLKVFSVVGPATAISILVSLLAAMTLLPAILALIGRRGWIKPRRDLTTRFWRRSGTRIVRRPKVYLVGSLIALIVLAGSASLIHLTYEDLKTLPQDVDSVRGYAEINRHFPMNAMTPMVLFIKSPSDLRTPTALADLEQMATRISQLPDVVMVRGLTRPDGEPLRQMKVSFQVGEVGSRLGEAATAITDHAGDLDKLADSGHELAGNLAQVRDQVTAASSSVSGLVAALNAIHAMMNGDNARPQLDNAAQVVGRMRALSANLSGAVASVEQIAVWAKPMVAALVSSPVCSKDPVCVRSRAELADIVEAETSGVLRSIAALAVDLRENQDPQTVGPTMSKLEQQLKQAIDWLKAADGLQAKMAQMEVGAHALAEGSAALAEGVQQLVDQTKKMGSGLNEASSFLLGIKHDASKPSMAGFNIPPHIMTRDEFKTGARIFLSADGHAARYFVQSALNPFTTQAMDQTKKIVAAAQSAQPNTELKDASVALAGVTAGLRDIRDYYTGDIHFIVFATVIIVFLILVVLLRAIVAPLYLIGSVLISYLSALGLGVVVFQLLMHQDMHWSLPGLSFVSWVAVGADYNMLLISRIRDESPLGVRVGVIRTVGSTGGVITSAGLIFAASMFGLLTASIHTMAQAGFTIGIGIVLDTFLVRTVTVPALAALIGKANWWPSEVGQSGRRRARQPSPVKGATVASPRRVICVRSRDKRLGSNVVQLTNVARYQLGGHALPLFGPTGLPATALTTTPANGSGNGNRKNLIEDLAIPALPWSSLAEPLHDGEGANSGGNVGRPVQKCVRHSLPLFTPVRLAHIGNGIGNAKDGNGHAD